MYIGLEKLNKSFGSFKASDNVSFEIEKGKLIALLGPSGSGKTTILRILAGLEHPDSGDIFIDEVRVNDLPARKRGIGFVFQNYALFRYMTVFDNIAFGLEVQKKKKKEIRERVAELLKLIGLDGIEHRYPHQLSGGQKQRVAFARALAPNPQLLLLDEPFAAIDAKVRHELRSWLRETISKVGITSIFVTHDQDEAIEVADDIIIMNHGKVEQIGTPLEIYQNPSSLFVAQFVGQSIIIDEYYKLKGFDKIRNVEQAIIRPEFIRISKKDENLQYVRSAEEGITERISYRGSYLEVTVNVKGMILTATRSLEERPIAIGEAINVLIYRLYVFDENNAAHLLVNPSIVNDESMVI